MPLVTAPIGLRTADLADTRERERIAAFVSAHPFGTPFHLPAWSVAVECGCRQRAHLLVAERADGSIAGIVPLTEMRSLIFGKALVSAGFGVGGGPLAEDDAVAATLADAAWSLAQSLACPTLELRGGAVRGEDWAIDDQTYLGFARPLAADDEAELLAIPRKQRAEARKALAGDLTITVARDAAAARAHYAVYAESVRNLGTPVFPRALFTAMLDAFGDDADILTVSAGGTPVAGVLSLYFNGTVFPYWGGGTSAARGLRANDAMYFALMRHARARGCTAFDFGRSKAGTGPAAFKKNWGFDGVPLAYHKRAGAGLAVREVNPLDPRYARKIEMWKKLPLWTANAIGPWLSRGLG
ncbi:MAG: FemAB family PEP-CTERM system-associated protein [Pseudomonadota bacterium]|nr:FemAB family PEP-CTERM system-associated protein [Pseudomonadota bacterium]